MLRIFLMFFQRTTLAVETKNSILFFTISLRTRSIRDRKKMGSILCYANEKKDFTETSSLFGNKEMIPTFFFNFSTEKYFQSFSNLCSKEFSCVLILFFTSKTWQRQLNGYLASTLFLQEIKLVSKFEKIPN